MLTKSDLPGVVGTLAALLLLLLGEVVSDYQFTLRLLAVVAVCIGFLIEVIVIPYLGLIISEIGADLKGAPVLSSIKWDGLTELIVLHVYGQLEWHLQDRYGGHLLLHEHERVLRGKLLNGVSKYVPGFPLSALRKAIASKQDWRWSRE